MVKDRKIWKCPYCLQTSARKWNLEVHINRIHAGRGLPMKIDHHKSTSNQLGDDNIKDYLNSENKLRDLSEDQLWRFPENVWPFTYYNMDPKSKDPLDDLIKFMHSTSKVISDIFQPKGGRSPYNQMTPPFPRQFFHSVYEESDPNHNIRNISQPPEENFNGVIGFKSIACKRCLTITTINLMQGRDKDLVEHVCDPDKLGEIQFFRAHQVLQSDIEKNIPQSLFVRCKEWAKDGLYGLYLRTCPILNEYHMYTKIDTAKLSHDSWILRALHKGEIFLNDSELLEFLQMAPSQTMGYFCILSTNGKKYNYLFEILRKPLLTLA